MNRNDLLNYPDELLEIFQRVMTSDNWWFIHQLFHRYFHCYKGYSLEKGGNYYALNTDLILEFYTDKRIMFSPTWTYNDFLEWFKNWLKNYDDIQLTDIDNAKLNQISHDIIAQKGENE